MTLAHVLSPHVSHDCHQTACYSGLAWLNGNPDATSFIRGEAKTRHDTAFFGGSIMKTVTKKMLATGQKEVFPRLYAKCGHAPTSGELRGGKTIQCELCCSAVAFGIARMTKKNFWTRLMSGIPEDDKEGDHEAKTVEEKAPEPPKPNCKDVPIEVGSAGSGSDVKQTRKVCTLPPDLCSSPAVGCKDGNPIDKEVCPDLNCAPKAPGFGWL
eukprot:GEMP01079513.1.p1 GENE.GEMP01079513.1~~GEMP01079513.1.p1  ORF type:complete len:212 (+),score=33.61 GEMP01079513.1:206-841(+)